MPQALSEVERIDRSTRYHTTGRQRMTTDTITPDRGQVPDLRAQVLEVVSDTRGFFRTLR
jgi:hypothetical protein